MYGTDAILENDLNKPLTSEEKVIFTAWYFLWGFIIFFILTAILALPVNAVQINPSVESQPYLCRLSFTKWICEIIDSDTPGPQGPQGKINMTMNQTPNMTAGPAGLDGTGGNISPYAGGNVWTCGTNANDDCIINGTSSATKTSSYVILQPDGGYIRSGSDTFDRNVDNSQFTIFGGTAAAGKGAGIQLAGAENPVIPGNITFYIPNAAKNNWISAAHISGVTDTPKTYHEGFDIFNIGNITIKNTDLENWAQLTAIEAVDSSILFGTDTDIHITGNAYFDGGWKRKTADLATNYYQSKGTHNFRVAGTGLINSAITWINALVISSTGNVSIGTTSPTAQLHTTGTWRGQIFGAGSLNTDANGNFYIISDPQYKTGIKPYTVGLKELLSIPSSAIITYKFKPESGLDTVNEYSGVDAKQLQLVLPSAVYEKGKVTYEQVLKTPEVKDAKTGEVTTEAEYEQIEKPVLDKDGKQVTELSVSNMPIIMAEVNAIRELNAKIEAQNQTIAKQEARIAALEKKVGIVKP